MLDFEKLKQRIYSTAAQSIITATYNKTTRAFLNGSYNRLSLLAKSKWHGLLAKAFRNKTATNFPEGQWAISWCNTKISIPLETSNLWLDWDIACSVLGHDPEIKKTYELILNSDIKPTVFFDVGANYGIDTLLHLLIIFESFVSSRRIILDFLTSIGYQIHYLSLDREKHLKLINFESWLKEDKNSNFIAIPKEKSLMVLSSLVQ